MIRFINLGTQLCLNDETESFSFYCTIKEGFESFCGTQKWETVEDFKEDYVTSGGKNLNRYLNLIPTEFKI